MGLRNLRTRPNYVAATTLVVAIGLLAGGCGSGVSNSTSSEGRRLAAKVLHAPTTFYAETTAGANGQITPALFSTYGGVRSPTKAGFVAGFKGNYVNASSTEGISVTIMEFESPKATKAYFDATSGQLLAYTSPTYMPYRDIPGAVQIDGTRPYAGDYDHAVAMTRGRYFALFVYATGAPAAPPVEFPYWVKAQYSNLS